VAPSAPEASRPALGHPRCVAPASTGLRSKGPRRTRARARPLLSREPFRLGAALDRASPIGRIKLSRQQRLNLRKGHLLAG
jgi:hypothetical protein